MTKIFTHNFIKPIIVHINLCIFIIIILAGCNYKEPTNNKKDLFERLTYKLFMMYFKW